MHLLLEWLSVIDSFLGISNIRKKLKNKISNQTKTLSLELIGRDADDETLDQSEIRVWLDMSNQQIGILLNRDLQLTYKDFAQGLLRDCDHNPKLGDIPIQFKEPIYGTSTPSFTDFVAPGVILT